MLVTYHDGATVQYNVVTAKRVKGNGRKIVERWMNSPEHPLIVRVKLDETSHPWVIGHRGYDEIFRSAIFINASQNHFNPETVHVFLKTWTKRKGDAIDREFLLTFPSSLVAKSFVFTNNLFLSNKDEDKETEGKHKMIRTEDRETGSDNSIDRGEDGHTGDDDDFDSYQFEDTQDPFSDYASD